MGHTHKQHIQQGYYKIYMHHFASFFSLLLLVCFCVRFSVESIRLSRNGSTVNSTLTPDTHTHNTPYTHIYTPKHQ